MKANGQIVFNPVKKSRTKRQQKQFTQYDQYVYPNYQRSKERTLKDAVEKGSDQITSEVDLEKQSISLDLQENIDISQEKKIAQDAKEEVIKEQLKKQKDSTEKLDKIVEQSRQPIFRCKCRNPFDLFPNEITIDFLMVNIIYREFFGSGEVKSVMIKNIEDAMVDRTPFFATLRITSKGVRSEPLIIKYLSPKDASKARRIIQGLRVCENAQIDLTDVSFDQLSIKLEEIGASHIKQ